MSDRYNLFPNPLFKQSGQQAAGYSSDRCTLQYLGDGSLAFIPKSGATIGGYAGFNMPVEPGSYVFAVHFDYAGPLPASDIRLNRLFQIKQATSATDTAGGTSLGAYAASVDSAKTYTLRFTVPDGCSYIRITLGASQSYYSVFRNPQLELASTYDAAVAGGGKTYPVVFTGDTRPE